MHTTIVALSGLALALVLASFAYPPSRQVSLVSAPIAMSPTDLTLAAGPLDAAAYVDAH